MLLYTTKHWHALEVLLFGHSLDLLSDTGFTLAFAVCELWLVMYIVDKILNGTTLFFKYTGAVHLHKISNNE